MSCSPYLREGASDFNGTVCVNKPIRVWLTVKQYKTAWATMIQSRVVRCRVSLPLGRHIASQNSWALQWKHHLTFCAAVKFYFALFVLELSNQTTNDDWKLQVRGIAYLGPDRAIPFFTGVVALFSVALLGWIIVCMIKPIIWMQIS